ncbi:hypothetical protein VHEMI06462 [[Torrubiella] hemipterigena]|uniref:Peptidase S8/S53 domain-containing protein n=1 Tax=[Torrubiella] hemipterigena TaxID=1531966 RepID=A0A0A1TJJ4_9HYPO|nr:hypothetical protein VHEMI06462 [[Torrubiella] hemipterigena]
MVSKPQFGAPGGFVLSKFPNTPYAALSGTSMATPHMAAIMALIHQVRGAMPVGTIENLLSSTAKAQAFNDSKSFYDFLAPAVQQSAGIVQTFDAAYTTLYSSRPA